MSNKIMVVDDNSATRRAVRNALQRHGHVVLEAPDGKTARELMSKEHPRVVLQDLMLPDTDGFTLVGELRSLAGGREVSILAFSGFVAELLESRVSTLEFDDIITKPIAPSRLVPIIEAHLPFTSGRVLGDRFGAGWRVVLADDDPMQLKLATFRLSRLGFLVEPVTNGREVLAAIRARRPDLVVSDVLMPELDGFALAIELRKDPTFNELPLVLITSTHVESSDRELARRAGASDLIHRTPDLAELVEALRAVVSSPILPVELRPETIPELEREHTQRVVRQLERQVRLNSELAQRCSALTSELAVLAGISDTILQHRDLPAALDEALTNFFDAGGIAGGAIYLLGEAGALGIQQVGSGHRFPEDAMRTLFGHPELLAEVIARGTTLVVPAGVPAAVGDDLLGRASATSLMVVPLGHGDVRLGALLMYARARELALDDWRAFGHGVATQIGQVIELSRAYDARLDAERRATSHAALLTAIVENAPDVIMQIDLDGTIRFANQRIETFPVETIVGHDWFTSLGEPQRSIVKQAFDESIATRQPTEVEQTFDTGSFSLHFGPVIEAGEVTGVVVVARDVSERKQAEIQLVLADRMASVGTLAAGVAHEINNPLASVISNLDLASTDLAKLDARVIPIDLVEEIRDARLGAERVREIVRDLKLFSRAEEDRRGPIDVEQVLDSTLRMAWTELRHRARVVKQYALIPRVDANESRLGQVFLNLLINAAHAIEEGNYEANEIRIRTRHRGDRVIVTIADTGAGITPEVRARLFTPFFTTKPAGVGTGLGLAISLRIISSFGGTVTFDSEVGHGSAFHVSLPAVVDEVVSPTVSRTSTRPHAERRGKILVIDDDVPLAQAIRRYLAPNHDVTVVHSGRAGLVLFEQGMRYDVILCDVMMPQVTGMELYRTIELVDGAQAEKVVFMTGGAFTISAREFLDTTPNARVEKPFDLKALRRLINDLIP